jgi:RNA polymerase sigma factor (TIGR02999 family)
LRLVARSGVTHAGHVGDVTVLLQRIQQGDPLAPDELMARVYAELRQMAAARMSRELPGHGLQATALVHEAWLRLGGDDQPNWQNRRHYFGAAAEAMRRILIEQARRRHAERHGGGLEAVPLDEMAIATEGTDEQALAVNDALEKLAAVSPQKAELVKLRYFAGLSLEETASALEISEATASRWWTFARAWLLQELTPASKK